MIIEFLDGSQVDIELIDSPIRQKIVESYHHLQYIKIPFKLWDCPIPGHYSIGERVDLLSDNAMRLGITVDKEKCMNNGQSYFNYLHEIVEKNYDGNPEWADFHNMIHLCERSSTPIPIVKINFHEMGGMLEQPFNRQWLSHAVTEIKAGDIFCWWSELGKHPYDYWLNKEPDDISRLCELSKPWLKLRPVLVVALDDINFCKNKKISDFNLWWQHYENPWCAHYGLTDWHWHEMFSVIPVGRVKDLDRFISNINDQIFPSYIRMQPTQPQTENLQIDLSISAKWKSHDPSINICVDDHEIPINRVIKGENKFNFMIEVGKGKHWLKIKRNGATYLDPEQMIVIEHLSIGKINCNKLILDKSTFYPRYPEPWATEQKQQGIELLETVPFETVLGHNGTWIMEFESPFYPFLLNTNP